MKIHNVPPHVVLNHLHSATRDKAGTVIDGDPEKLTDVTEGLASLKPDSY